MDARYLALVPLPTIFEIGFDGIAFAGLLRRAPVVFGVRVQGLDELLLDARLVLAVVICVEKSLNAARRGHGRSVAQAMS